MKRGRYIPRCFASRYISTTYIYPPPLQGIVVYYPRPPLPLQYAYFKMADYKHQFVIIYSVGKRFELNKRSLSISNSENEKHERHDPPCFNLPSWSPGAMHTMRGSSERNGSSTDMSVEIAAPLDRYVGRHIDRYVGRDSGRHSADTLTVDYRPNIGRLSVVYRSAIGGLSVDCLIIMLGSCAQIQSLSSKTPK